MVENRMFALCTLHDDPTRRVRTHLFAFSPDGSELCARMADSVEMRPISECKKPDAIYIVNLDISSACKQLNWSRLPRASNPPSPNQNYSKPVSISIRDGLPAVLVQDGSWSVVHNADRGCMQTRHTAVHVRIVNGSDILDAVVCFQVIDGAYKLDCHSIIWNHWNCLPNTEPDRLGNFLKGQGDRVLCANSNI